MEETFFYTVFSVHLNVYTINVMWVNEEEILDISDTLSLSVKQSLKHKWSHTHILSEVFTCSSLYTSLFISHRLFTSQISLNIIISKIFFRLFITVNYLQLIAHHININAETKQIKKKWEFSREEEDREERAWHITTESEIEIFLSVLLLQSDYKLAKVSDYWNTVSNKSIILLILKVMTVQW